MAKKFALLIVVALAALVTAGCQKKSGVTSLTAPSPAPGVSLVAVDPPSGSSPSTNDTYSVEYTIINAAVAVVWVRDDTVSWATQCGSTRGVSPGVDSRSFSGMASWARGQWVSVMLVATSVEAGCPSIERNNWQSATISKKEVARWRF